MKKLLPMLAGLLLLGACHKDSPTPTVSKADVLTAKNWRITEEITSVTANGQTSTSDDYANSQPCERDNFTKFSANYTLVIDEGATKCSSSDPQTTAGSWAFASNETKITLATQIASGVSYSLTFDIVELSATTMKLRYTDTSPSYTAVRDVTFTSF